MKLIFVTWWVVSWLGKWITASSIWRLMKSAWYKVNIMKMDPYLQIDAGTMSPYEHGEVFVTDDWAETDLDLWHYERFVDVNLSCDCSVTSWKIYFSVIQKERQWDYLWKTVQVIPHITDEIKSRVKNVAKDSDVTIIEIWWTIWDIEALHFIEAIRQLKKDVGHDNVLYVHVAPIMFMNTSWEIKTKPVQHSVRDLRQSWIQADILICRTSVNMSKDIKEKISLLCDVDTECVIEAIDAKSIYEVPLLYKNQNLDKIIQKKLNLKENESDLSKWSEYVNNLLNPEKTITIWIVWKYTQFRDTYLSLMEAISHAWANNKTKVKLNWIESETLENIDYMKYLAELHKSWQLDGMIIPWWFWKRWVEWKINAVRFARENNIPFLWICLWLQVSVMEFARNVCNIKDANSTEFDENAKEPVIDFMEEQREITQKGWTMRLWEYKAILKEWTLAFRLYWQKEVFERHRHRYEVNFNYHKVLQENWLVISWLSPNNTLAEFIEIPNHKYFIATQSHPELKSRINNVHPLFDGLVKACLL